MIDALAAARAIEADTVALRHDLHRHPEPGMDLPGTQERVLAALQGLPLEITLGKSLSSIVAVLRGGAAPDGVERPTVLLRADMDALPVHEETGQPFASQVDGAMHACGHDMHSATLVSAARILCEHAAQLPGDVVFMFQPGEEVLAGAKAMIEEGVLDAAGRRVDRAFGLHALSAVLPHGVFTVRAGTMMAGADVLAGDIVGVGGHGSAPHLANDPVPVMAEAILALQTVVTRKFSVFDPIVINVGIANAGQAYNVIPERCHIEASIRTLTPQTRAKASKLLPSVVEQVCSVHGATAELEWLPGVGPTVNEAAAARFTHAQLAAVLGDERVVELQQPFMGSEDFSEVLADVPGAFVFYSAVPADLPLEKATFNHSATAMFDDYPLADATAAYVQLAQASLAEIAAERSA